MRHQFGHHVLDLETRELREEGRAIEMEPRTFDVLAYLIAHRDRVVPKEELLDEVWGDRFVSESALTTRVKHARTAIGDDGRTQRCIKTIHRVGYRFVADVTEARPEGGASPGADRHRPHGADAARELLGRDDDVRAVSERLVDHRLVTVTGAGGVGKTALVRCVMEGPAVGERAWMCELANTRDPDSVPNVVLTSLGEGQQLDADPTESLLRVLEERSDLLVLDNCEHLASAAGSLATDILGRCPGVLILATSRSALDVEGESLFPLEPLQPADAARCFVARAAEHGATADPADPALAELCLRLDCLPLALELAAARTRLLQPAEMVELLSDRFRLLRTSADREDRHASLEQAIAWSWDDLAEADRRTLARMSVFVGSFTLEDVAAVALEGADPLDAVDALDRLVRCSLVETLAVGGGRTRYRLLESVRDFASGELSQADRTELAHARHFARRAEELDEACQTDAVDAALVETAATWDNLRAAVGYAAGAGEVETVRRIVRAVAQYGDVYGVYEVSEWCEAADLDTDPAAEDDVALAADALAVKARMLAHQGRHEEAGPLAERARARHESHTTLLSVAWSAYYTGALDVVVDTATRLADLSRSQRGLDHAYAEGFAAIVTAVRQEAELTSTAVTPADADGGALGALDVLTEGLRLCTADPEKAAELLEAAVGASLRRDYRLVLGAAASTLTQITLPARPPDEAMATLRRTLTRYRERAMWNLIAADIVMAARLLADAGDVATAARLIGARMASGYSVGLSEVLSLLVQEELSEVLGSEYEALVEQGSRWRPPEAADVAIDALRSVLEDATGPA